VDESHHRVLIVDGERTIAETLALVFSSGGYETCCFSHYLAHF
jgi:DNA-binding response OmpR family regulator